ncbi:MFS transporter [Amycolatopsis sp. NPDC059027]|uniref:MFS transporter n=1 Tax=Amycolatopsis sp. NPDC059027 TaxID=3346709 RepID=UPI0036711B04
MITHAVRSKTPVLLAMCAGMFLVQLDVTVVNVALPTIGTELRAGLGAQQWVVDGYSVVLAALLLTGGTLGDVFGHRRIVHIGLTIFGAASALCALAGSVPWLVLARAGQGLGAALLLPGTLAVITGAYPERRERARALGAWAGISAVALAAGPLLGGFVVAAGGWRPVFWLNVPVVVLAILATQRFVPPHVPAARRRVDVAGALTAALALGSGVFAVIDANAMAAVLAVVAAVAFVVIEHRAADPMLPLNLLRSRATAGANLIAMAMNFVGLGSILVLTLYLQRVLGADSLVAALEVFPMFLPLSALGPLSGRLAARFGPRPLMLSGLALGALSLLNLLRIGPDSGYPALLPTMLGLGVGMGLLTPAVVTAAVAGIPAERAGIASGVNNTARQAAGALGVAVFGAVAGEPAHRDAFLAGLHTVGLAAAVLWVAAIAVTLVTIPVR